MAATIQARSTQWGQWFRDFIQCPLGDYDIARDGLRCAIGLPGMDAQLIGLGVEKLNDWTDAVEHFTKTLRRKFRRTQHSQGEFLVASMVECIQRKLGIQYNYDFMEGEYDASDSRNLFIHGPLTGFGGAEGGRAACRKFTTTPGNTKTLEITTSSASFRRAQWTCMVNRFHIQ